MKKYFFGFLFVRIAKLLAILLLLAGGALTALRAIHATVAVEAIAYQPQPSMRQQIEPLLTTLSHTQRLVSQFNPADEDRTERISISSSTAQPKTMRDFSRTRELLRQVDVRRGLLKNAVIAQFDTAVSEIESRLRSHAASVAPPTQSPDVVDPPSQPSFDPSQPAATEMTSLYVSNIRAAEIEERKSTLQEAKQILSVLRDSAESADNKDRLSASLTQLDSFVSLLPAATLPHPVVTPPAFGAVQPQQRAKTVPDVRNPLPAEKVAERVRDLRRDVRDAVLSSWSLDEAYESASAAVADEEAKCRSATFASKSIWLNTAGQIGAIIVVTALLSFFILVTADLTRTLLDTAVNTGVVADYYTQSSDQE